MDSWFLLLILAAHLASRPGAQSTTIHPTSRPGSQSTTIHPTSRPGAQSTTIHPTSRPGAQSTTIHPTSRPGAQSTTIHPTSRPGAQSTTIHPTSRPGAQSTTIHPTSRPGAQSTTIHPTSRPGAQSTTIHPTSRPGAQSTAVVPVSTTDYPAAAALTNTTTTTAPTNTTTTAPTNTTTTAPTNTTTTADPTTTTTTAAPTTTTTTTTAPTNTTTAAPTNTTTADPTTTTADTTTTAAAPTYTTTADPTTTTADPTTTTAAPTNTTTAAAPTNTTTTDTTTTTATPTNTTTTDPTTTTADPTTTTAAPTNTTITTAPTYTTTADPTTTTADATTTTAAPTTTTTTAAPTNTTTTAPTTAPTTADPTTTTTTAADPTTTPPPPPPITTTTTTDPTNTTTAADPTTTTADPTTTPPFPPPITTTTTTTADPTTTTADPTTPPPPPITTTTPPPPTTTTTTTTPPAPSSTTPPTTTPLVCANGGVSLGGVCICPDEWTGDTCSEENFCRARELEGFTFPITPIDWFAYSEETCPEGTSGAGKPLASTRCSTRSGSPSFEDPPQVFQCDQTLSDIQQNLTSPADLEQLASSAQILTSKPAELTAEDVTAAAQIANTLLLSPNATERVRVAAVATVSQLLNASTPDGGEEDNATLGLTVTLDQLSVNLSLGTSQSQVVQPNLVVQSVQIPATDTQGVQFTSLSGTSGSFVADRIQLNTNTSAVVVENGFIADAVIFVQFPTDQAFSARQKPANASLGFVLYQNDRFFRSRRYRRRRATIRVLSANVQGPGRSVAPQHVEMLFRPTVRTGTSLFDFACVFWDYGLEDWSTAGCSKGNASDGLLRCFCNHTTNFAALWSFRVEYEYAEALDAISVVGLSVSILGLMVTIIHHVRHNFQISCCKKPDEDHDSVKDSQIALLCICFSLLAFIITFVTGVGNSSRRAAPVEVDTRTNSILDSDEHVEPDGGSCSAVAALLHFFLLATFVWNGVYGTLALWVDTMGRSLPAFWTPLSAAVGWGVPAAIMAVSLGATYSVDNPLGYRQEEFCWLAGLDQDKRFHFEKPMFWGFLLPVALILIYNVVLLVLILKSMKRRLLWRKFLNSFSLAMLLGLSWSLGYLVLVTTGHTHLVFSILFCLCTTTQGFQIFVLLTARTPAFRASMSRSVKYVSSVNIQLKNTKYSLQRNWTTTGSESYRDLRD